MFYEILFWIITVIDFWLALRNLITIISGSTQLSTVRIGQRPLHLISLLIFLISAIIGILTKSILFPISGIVLEYIFRNWIIKESRRQLIEKENNS
jgi:hypothetical protein